MAFLIGGLEYQEQIYDSTVTQMSACLLALAVLSLLIPVSAHLKTAVCATNIELQTAFHASFSDLGKADHAVLKLSRGTSVILLIIYVLYLLFQLKSHAYLYQGTPQHIIDEEATPGILQRFDSTSSSSATSTRSSITSNGSRRRVSKRLKAKLGRKREVKTEVHLEEEPEQIGPSVTEYHTEKTAEPEDMDLQDKAAANSPTIPSSSTTKPQNGPIRGMPTNAPAASAQKRNPGPGPRGLSFRTPPVFRSSTNPNAGLKTSDQHSHTLRHYSSAPDHKSQNAGAVGLARPPSARSIPAEKADEPPMGQTASIVLLLVSTGLVALCAEFLVGSINSLVVHSPLSEAFIGLIILPIVGNAAEHVTAVTVAAKNKLDLALGVALGSSIQIALFVTPFVVILGWIMDKDMSLYFSLFEVASLFVATFIVNFLVLDGRSNYLEGALLCACYVIVAVGAYFFPDGQDQSSLTSGPSSN